MNKYSWFGVCNSQHLHALCIHVCSFDVMISCRMRFYIYVYMQSKSMRVYAIMQLTKFTYTVMLSYTFAFLVSNPYMMTHIFVHMSTLVEASK